MNDRIDIAYEALDEMAHAIGENENPIPMTTLHEDPNRSGEICVWPETFLAWKQKVKKAEKDFNRKALTDFQWNIIETYMLNQYHFCEIPIITREKWA